MEQRLTNKFRTIHEFAELMEMYDDDFKRLLSALEENKLIVEKEKDGVTAYCVTYKGYHYSNFTSFGVTDMVNIVQLIRHPRMWQVLMFVAKTTPVEDIDYTDDQVVF